jgi:hypothetical protein
MNYIELRKFLPEGEFIFKNISSEELLTVPCGMYLTEFDGIIYISVNMDLEDFADRKVIPTEEEAAELERIKKEREEAEEAAAKAYREAHAEEIAAAEAENLRRAEEFINNPPSPESSEFVITPRPVI